MNGFHSRAISGRPLILGHRGDSAFAPENTLEAAVRGHAAGADGWELDVRLTRDEVPVVIHDASLLRTTDVQQQFAHDSRKIHGYQVSDFDWNEIQTLDAGSWFVNPSGGWRSAVAFGTLDAIAESDRKAFESGTLRIPSLDQALRLTIDLDCIVNVELKTFPEGNAPLIVQKVVDLIAKLSINDRVLISSFQHSDLFGIFARLPDVVTGVLTTTPIWNPPDYVRHQVGADFYHPSTEVLGSISDSYRRNPTASNLASSDYALSELPTFVYTVNDPILAANLGEIGVAGIFSDYPGRIRKLFA